MARSIWRSRRRPDGPEPRLQEARMEADPGHLAVRLFSEELEEHERPQDYRAIVDGRSDENSLGWPDHGGTDRDTNISFDLEMLARNRWRVQLKWVTGMVAVSLSLSTIFSFDSNIHQKMMVMGQNNLSSNGKPHPRVVRQSSLSRGKWELGELAIGGKADDIEEHLAVNPSAMVPEEGFSRRQSHHGNCNSIHEIGPEDLSLNREDDNHLVWEFLEIDGSLKAFKMYRYRLDQEHGLGPSAIELQRRDAIVREITSSSPYTVDIYGYCAASAIHEFEDGGEMLENVLRDGPVPRGDLLPMALRVASSVMDVHHIDYSEMPTIAHSNLSAKQYVLINGDYKLTGFYSAKLLQRSTTTNHTHPFKCSVISNWFAPEVHKQAHSNNSIVTEKMDIWNMGNVFYFMLTGHPPFHGHSTSEIHSLFRNQPVTPIIAKALKAKELEMGHDSIYLTMIAVIAMCMKDNPAHRPTARYVTKFIEDSIKKERAGRSTRFPSIEERVKFYMSNWYTPTCDDNRNAIIEYRMISGEGSDNNVLFSRHNDDLKRKDAVEIGSSMVRDRIVMIAPSMLVETTRNGYMDDVVETISPLLDILDGCPLLMQFGDKSGHGLPHNTSLALPHFKKFRRVLSKDDLAQINQETCWTNSSHRSGPMLWKLNSNRHERLVKSVAKNDKPWHQKQPKAVFRGHLTGHVDDAYGRKIENMSDMEICSAIVRCRFVLKHCNSSLVDAKLTSLLGKPLEGTLSGVNLLGAKMSLQEMLDYKVLIMLEGNDVSSGLKWALGSNSVVMMPPPKFTTWWMEELLKPWVHYVPLNPSLNDTEEKMQWVLNHEKEAQMISFHGSLWMQDLYEHSDSKRDNNEINKQMLERYKRFFVQVDSTSI
ncbi:hypothetical protein ACHAWF_012418 [Thalassiosira exigua]